MGTAAINKTCPFADISVGARAPLFELFQCCYLIISVIMSANEATLEVFHGRKKLRAGTALCELDQFLEQCVKDDR
jgi:hypothetical protein